MCHDGLLNVTNVGVYQSCNQPPNCSVLLYDYSVSKRSTLMDTALDDIEFLVSSQHRFSVLDALKEPPCNRREFRRPQVRPHQQSTAF